MRRYVTKNLLPHLLCCEFGQPMKKNTYSLKIVLTQLSNLKLYGDYLNNYKRAQNTVEKCAKENAQFASLIEVRNILF